MNSDGEEQPCGPSLHCPFWHTLTRGLEAHFCLCRRVPSSCCTGLTFPEPAGGVGLVTELLRRWQPLGRAAAPWRIALATGRHSGC